MEEMFIEWIDAIGMFFLGAGALWFAYIGQATRSDKRFEYKFELAKDAIKIFNKYRNDFQQIRSPLVYEGDTKKLQNLPEDNQLVKKMKAHPNGGIALMRLDERAATLAEMNRLEPEFVAIFGKTSAFKDMRSVRQMFFASAYALVHDDAQNEHYEVIWRLYKEEDLIEKRIDDAVKQVEGICIPVLGGKGGL